LTVDSEGMSMDSRIPGFYEDPVPDRLETVADRCGLSASAREAISGGPDGDVLYGLSENVVGSISYPLSVATNFVVDGDDALVPMAVEESSVVAAASHGAKLARETGGFETSVSGPYMIGQVQVRDVADPHSARSRILARSEEIREEANDQGVLVSHGGGCEEVTARVVSTPRGEMVVVHLVVNVCDAMGANAVNTMAEAVAPLVEDATGGEAVLRILSNRADRRLARAHCTIPPTVLEREDSDFTGERVRDRIVDAWALAVGDPYRAATHNKGVLNGMDALAVATTNDWRAIEAGAHAHAARDGYGPLSAYEVDDDGNLACSIEVPVQVGVVGGATRAHPTASAAMEILDVDSADDLAGIFAAVGLAENLASMRALSDEGIQAGHMKLHAKNVAREAGADGDLVEEIAARMVAEDDVRAGRARELIDEME
jgi:hydroxymethylglutaryl-CoA reductase